MKSRKGQVMDLALFARGILALDLEIHPETDALLAVGALLDDRELRIGLSGEDPIQVLQGLDEFAKGAEWLLGHNLVAHDLAWLTRHAPWMRLHSRPAIDTLLLAPLAFPRHPYHRLYKGYKTNPASKNDPLRDARAALTFFSEEVGILSTGTLLPVFLFLLSRSAAYAGCGQALARLSGQKPVDLSRGLELLKKALHGAVCDRALEHLPAFLETMDGAALALATAWAVGADERSRLAPWVVHQFPEAVLFLQKTRQAGTCIVPLAPTPGLAFGDSPLSVRSPNHHVPTPDSFSPSHGNSNLTVPSSLSASSVDPSPIPSVLSMPSVDNSPNLSVSSVVPAVCGFCREYHEPTTSLQRFFGFSEFRPISDDPPITQREVAEAILHGQDLMVILSTGGGKSLCYQLPAKMLARQRNLLTLVISPLQSLMKDQVDSLKNRGILDVGAINGMQTILERMEMIEGVALGHVNILFAAPEQMRNENFCKVLQQRELGLVVIDEAHCLSKWGHDFRPDYLYICKFLRAVLGERRALPTIACFTATAKRDVIEEIRAYFRNEAGKDLRLIQGGLDRPNLHFFVSVLDVSAKRPRILEILRHSIGDGAAIVFAATRKKAEDIAQFLQQSGYAADCFHAGLPPDRKHLVQQRFLDNEIRVITATNAFGMGVDKPDIRVVIHADVPGSLENYLQEAGRAGRDRNAAECHLLFCQADLEDQFTMSSRSRITFADLNGIFRGIKHLAQTPSRGSGRSTAAARASSGGSVVPEKPAGTDSTAGVAPFAPGAASEKTPALSEKTLPANSRAASSSKGSDSAKLPAAAKNVGPATKSSVSSGISERSPASGVAPTSAAGLSGPQPEPRLHPVVKTTGEILRDEATDTDSFDLTDEMADTKVKIALSWLEKVKCLERTWNRTSVIQAKPRLASLEESLQRLRELGLPGRTRTEWGQLLSFLYQSQDGGIFNTDGLSDLLGREGEEIQKTLRDMKQAGIIDCNLLFSAFVANQPGNLRDSKTRWLRAKKLEFGLRNLLSEQGELGDDNSLILHFRGVATILKTSTRTPDAIQEDIKTILQGWQSDGTVTFRSHGFEQFHLQFSQSLQEVHEASHQRYQVAELILRHLLRQTREKGANLRVSFSYADLEALIGKNAGAATGGPPLPDPATAPEQTARLIKKALLTLHETRVISLQNGLAVFRPALSLTLSSTEPPRAKDCEDLAQYFDEKTAQIHVMGKYAEYGQNEIKQAQELVRDYFHLDHSSFSSRYFQGQKYLLDIPTGEESLNRIVGKAPAHQPTFALSNEQRAIVQEGSARNVMVLAGPGSGKTKTLVHRAAWLVRVKRVPWGSVLIVAFNRSTVLEIRHRLKQLIGRDARQVQVQTYHGLALRISGRSLAVAPPGRKNLDFDQVMANVVQEAVGILEGLKGRDRDEMTGGLIGKLKYILVDEYQDVNEDQYRMISLLARKDEPEAVHRVHLLAVGDDDQNIYTWNGADVRFLRQFTADYEAATHHLLTNYRSSPEIVDQTAAFIDRNRDRMKQGVVMQSVRHGQLPGPRDGVSFLTPAVPAETFAVIVREIKRLTGLGFAPHEIAVLTRLNEDILKTRFLAEEAGFATAILRKPQISVLRLREVQRFLDRLKEATRQEPPLEMVAEAIQLLREDVADPDNPWEMLINSVVEQYFEETSHPSMSDCFHFFMDSVREFRQGETRREGFVSLSTMHAAKGLEFPAVILLLDGVQPTPEDRRLAYVAMTRAKEALTVVTGAPKAGVAPEIAAISQWRAVERLSTSAPLTTRVVELGPKDIHLSWPASHAGRQIIDTIAALKVGSRGEFVFKDDEFRILIKGVPVVRSSKAGAKRLKEFAGLPCAEAVCYAVLTRAKSEEDAAFAGLVRHETWEYPLFQLTFAGPARKRP